MWHRRKKSPSTAGPLSSAISWPFEHLEEVLAKDLDNVQIDVMGDTALAFLPPAPASN
jgi:hypothetical protein